MGESKKETKKSVSSNAGQAISKRILVADDNKAIELYEQHGFKDGNVFVDWLEAERQTSFSRHKELN